MIIENIIDQNDLYKDQQICKNTLCQWMRNIIEYQLLKYVRVLGQLDTDWVNKRANPYYKNIRKQQ